MKILTVSIAAYNVEKYIEKALDSLCHSEFLADMEIFVQTNAATDSTVKIAKKYEEKYPESIRVLERPVNGGYGSTINDSITMATGKYFKTLDGDDWYNINDLDQFICELKKCETDLVLSDFSTFQGEQFLSRWKPSMEPNRECSVEICQDCRMHSLTVRTSVLQQKRVTITENCFYTDIEYFLKAFKYADSLCYIPLSIYCYRLGNNEQSVSIASHLRTKNNTNLTCHEKYFGSIFTLLSSK